MSKTTIAPPTPSVRSRERSEGYPGRPATTGADLLPAIRDRWSPVRFDATRDVHPADLRAILEAARWAPSCFGDEPWDFLVATRDDPHREAFESCLSDGNAWAKRASVLLAGVARTRFRTKDRPNRWGAHDLGLATAMLLVEATSRGLITHPMGGFDAGELREAFDVPDDHDPMWVMAVGHYDPSLDDGKLAERDGKPRERRPLEAFVHRGSFAEASGL